MWYLKVLSLIYQKQKIMTTQNLKFKFSSGLFATLSNQTIADKFKLEVGKDYLLFHKAYSIADKISLIELSIYIGDYTASSKILPANEGCEKIGELEYNSFEQLHKDWTNAEALQNFSVYGHALRANTAGIPVK